VLVTGLAALLLAFPAAAARSGPTAEWLVQARCIHLQEGPWTANTGNGYFGGFQFAAKTWRRVGGKPDPAFAHPGDPTVPFSASAQEQIRRAWLIWQRDGGTWRAWGAIGVACSAKPALATS
jgi:resuscitation-promoting factor RpfA